MVRAIFQQHTSQSALFATPPLIDLSILELNSCPTEILRSGHTIWTRNPQVDGSIDLGVAANISMAQQTPRRDDSGIQSSSKLVHLQTAAPSVSPGARSGGCGRFILKPQRSKVLHHWDLRASCCAPLAATMYHRSTGLKSYPHVVVVLELG